MYTTQPLVGVNQQSSQQYGYINGSQTQQQQSSSGISNNSTDLFHTNHNVAFSTMRRSSRPKDLSIDLTIVDEQSSPYSASYVIQPHHQHIQQQQQMYAITVNTPFQSQQRTGSHTPHTYPFLTSHISSPNQQHTLINNTTAFTFPPPQSPVQRYNSVPASPNNSSNISIVTSPRHQKMALIQQSSTIQHSYNQQTQQSQIQLHSPLILNHTNSRASTPKTLNSNNNNSNIRLLATSQWSNNALNPLMVAHLHEHSINVNNDQKMHYNNTSNNNNRIDVNDDNNNNDDDDEDPSASIDALVADVDATSNAILQQKQKQQQQNQPQSASGVDQDKQSSQDQPHLSQTSPLYIRGHSQVLNTPPNPLALDDHPDNHPDNHLHLMQHQPVLSPSTCKSFQQSFNQSSPLHSAGFQLNNNETSSRSKSYFTFDASVTSNKTEQQTLNDTVFNTNKDLIKTLNNHHHSHGKTINNSDNEKDHYDNSLTTKKKPLMTNTDCMIENEQSKDTTTTPDMIVDRLLNENGTKVESISQRTTTTPVTVPIVVQKKTRKKMDPNRAKTSTPMTTNGSTQIKNPFQSLQNRHCCTYADCTKIFANKSALAKHKLTHSQDRRHKCEKCNKGFKRLDHLHGHMLTHEEDKPHKCKAPGCSRTYCDARSLKRHIENQHQDILAAIHEGGHDDYKQYLPETAYVKTKESSSNLQGDYSMDSNDSLRSTENLEQQQQQVDLGTGQKAGNKILPTYTFDEEKCVQCQLCKKTFKNGAALNGHMRLHGGFSTDNKPQSSQQLSDSKKRSTVTREDSDIKRRPKRKRPDESLNNKPTPPTLISHSFINCLTPDSAHCSSSTTPLSTTSVSPPLNKQQTKRPPLYRSVQIKSEEEDVNDDYLHNFTSIHSQQTFHPFTTRYDDKSRIRSVSSSVIERHALPAYAIKNPLSVQQQQDHHQITHQLNPTFKNRKQQPLSIQTQLSHHKDNDNMRNVQDYLTTHQSMDLLNHPSNNSRMMDNAMLPISNHNSPSPHRQQHCHTSHDDINHTIGLPGGLRFLSSEHQYNEKLRKSHSENKFLQMKSYSHDETQGNPLSHDDTQRNPLPQAIFCHHLYQQQHHDSQKKMYRQSSDNTFSSQNYGSHSIPLQQLQQHETNYAKKQNNSGNNKTKHHHTHHHQPSQNSSLTFHQYSHPSHADAYPTSLLHAPQHSTTNLHADVILRNQITNHNHNNKTDNSAIFGVLNYITPSQMQQAATIQQQNPFNQIKPERRYLPLPHQLLTDLIPLQEHLKPNQSHSPSPHEQHMFYHLNDNNDFHRTPSTSPYRLQPSPYAVSSSSLTPQRIVLSPRSIDHQQTQAQRTHSQNDKSLACSTTNTPQHSPLSDHHSPYDPQQSVSDHNSDMTTPIHQHTSPAPVSSSSSSHRSSPPLSCIVPKKRKYTLPMDDINSPTNTCSAQTKSDNESNSNRQSNPLKTITLRKKNNSVSYSTSTFEPVIDTIVAPNSVHNIETTFAIDSIPSLLTTNSEEKEDEKTNEADMRIEVENVTAEDNEKSCQKENSLIVLKVVPDIDEKPLTCDISVGANNEQKRDRETNVCKQLLGFLISSTSSSDKTPSSNASSHISSSSSNGKHFQYDRVPSITVTTSRTMTNEPYHRLLSQPLGSPSFLWPSQTSQLRRQQSSIPYTPPPMLSPYRKGPGLYYHVFSATPTAASTPTTMFPQAGQQLFTSMTNKPILSEFNKQEYDELIPTPKSDVSIQDLLPRINVGEQYQVNIPECNPNDLSVYDDNLDELLFSPYNMPNINEELFDRFGLLINKNVLCPISTTASYPLELIYMLLYEFDGDIEMTYLALLEGKTTKIKKCRPIHTYKFAECEIWTKQEINLYNQSIVKHEKNFELVSKDIGTKSVKQCIEYYYIPKKQLNSSTSTTKRKRQTKTLKCSSNPSQQKHHNLKNNLIDDTSSSSSTTISDNNRMDEENNNETNFLCKIDNCQMKFDTERSYRAHRNEHRRCKLNVLPTKQTNYN